MNGNARSVIVGLALLMVHAAQSAEAQEIPSSPMVYEEVDLILIVQTGENSFARVYFIRDDMVFADRLFSSDMHWSHNGRNFVLTWEDYCHGRISRVVEAKQYSFLRMPELPRDENSRSRDWWAMNKNMRDLKRPE